MITLIQSYNLLLKMLSSCVCVPFCLSEVHSVQLVHPQCGVSVVRPAVLQRFALMLIISSQFSAT